MEKLMRNLIENVLKPLKALIPTNPTNPINLTNAIGFSLD